MNATTAHRSSRVLALAMLVAMLVGPLLQPASAAANGFADVPSSHTFHREVSALADAGITRGCDDDRFCPDDVVTRGQMAAFLTRALDLPAGTATFDDTRGHTFATPIAALARAGITHGCDSDRFCPDQPVTRGQMAAFLTRAGLTTTATAHRSTTEPKPKHTNDTPTSKQPTSEPTTEPTPHVTTQPTSGDAEPWTGPVVGAHVHATWTHYDDDLRGRVLDQLASAGITSIRVDMGWAAIEEQCRGCISDWYVDRIDRTLEQAAARGIDVLGVVWYSPAWATDGGPTTPPNDPAEYGRHAGWIAERFEGRVAAWQLWNEPNLDSFFKGTVAEYVELVRAAAPAIRAADPSTPVVLGGPSHNDTTWLREVLGHGVGDLVDVIAVQPYHVPSDQSPSMPDTEAGDPGRFLHLATFIEVVEEFAPGTPVWLTEFGWSTHANEGDPDMWERGVTREQQAAFTIEALRLLQDRFPQVERAYLYRALDRDKGQLHQDNFGLLDTQARAKPVLTALRELLVP